MVDSHNGRRNVVACNAVTKVAVYTTEKVARDNEGVFGDPKNGVNQQSFRVLMENIVTSKLRRKFA